MFFQAIMIDLMNLVIPFFLYSGLVLIIIGGAIYLNRGEIVEKSILFVIIGALEIIYQFIAYRIFSLFDEIFGLGFDEYIFFMSIGPNILSIITFGILMIVLGKLNSENSGNFLLISGILWTIYASTIVIINLFIPTGLFIVIMIELIIFVLMIVARIFFVVYSAKIGEKVFLIASIFLLISSATSIIFSIFFTILP